ncbi:MAG: type II toxin-antitoxin system toxin DNA ADP-ribosyl transferase DarT [Ardenticatenaceae bacterium]
MSKDLNPDKALIFRITHLDNVRWILDNGLHCRNSEIFDPDFVNIGNLELIDKRQHRVVAVPPGGTLSDYIPFYFTPFSPMMLNIKTGWGGITKHPNHEIVILVSSLHKLANDGRKFVFSDRHAYLEAAQFYANLADLDRLDWAILQARNFKRDSDDMERFERYQAEALIHQHMPVESLTGIVCFNATVKKGLDALLTESDMRIRIVAKPSWYF